jgi:large subunit ribosomal protein L22
MKALLTNYHQSPRKVRLVADLIRGKSVAQAKAALMFLPKKSSPAIEKLLDSAVSNARQAGADVEALFVKTIAVNKGIAMRRFKPMARGRASRYQKTLSHVSLELGSLSVAASKKAAKKSTKKNSKLQATS